MACVLKKDGEFSLWTLAVTKRFWTAIKENPLFFVHTTNRMQLRSSKRMRLTTSTDVSDKSKFTAHTEDITFRDLSWSLDNPRMKRFACFFPFSVGQSTFFMESTLPGAGFGLFALQNFKAGDKITWYDGVIKTKEELGPNPTHARSLGLSTGLYIDASPRVTLLKQAKSFSDLFNNLLCVGGAAFANDGTSLGKNNSTFVTKKAHAGAPLIFDEVWLVALKDIAFGEEIFVSYGPSRDKINKKHD